MTYLSIDAARLLERLSVLGNTGRDASGTLTRLAASSEDKLGRDLLVSWLRSAGLSVTVDGIGNIFGIWGDIQSNQPLMIGSHIDTVINAGILDGCYGVLSALSVIEALQGSGKRPARPIVLAAFTNEEGVRYQPDMMGSLVFAGGYSIRPAMYFELHIEQGPILEAGDCTIGVVEDLQGISWQRVTIEGVANHAGTTPMAMRRDAGLAAARVITFLRDEIAATPPTVATVGSIKFQPDAINIIPSRAVLTVDLRDPDEQRLVAAEQHLTQFVKQLGQQENVEIRLERIVRLEPVAFDRDLVGLIERAADARGFKSRRMTSGAGHDAQMIARVCPAAMIFVPSRGGISHNPMEHTDEADLVAGANVLLDVVAGLSS